VNQYFAGVIPQLRERARHLVSLIPRDLERDVDSLIVICRDRLNAVGQELQWLLDSSDLALPANQATRVRLLRRAVRNSTCSNQFQLPPCYDGARKTVA